MHTSTFSVKPIIKTEIINDYYTDGIHYVVSMTTYCDGETSTQRLSYL